MGTQPVEAERKFFIRAVDGRRLLLFYDGGLGNARQSWEHLLWRHYANTWFMTKG